eukprot:CAMPEP_0174717242 /NCGR_PEP_ID=MMETSP1094-20130205/26305_1 /TAXON_ID=156173 /ORGANISM="Chrysochromulina brevifilum, Strain UTEX LB 985" /LENGTH=518 /DNA_ID=CAMNT_0015917155 /DNA_START=89 /DNA_END=1645 /DNA_ORIENTATION=-
MPMFSTKATSASYVREPMFQSKSCNNYTERHIPMLLGAPTSKPSKSVRRWSWPALCRNLRKSRLEKKLEEAHAELDQVRAAAKPTPREATAILLEHGWQMVMPTLALHYQTLTHEYCKPIDSRLDDLESLVRQLNLPAAQVIGVANEVTLVELGAFSLAVCVLLCVLLCVFLGICARFRAARILRDGLIAFFLCFRVISYSAQLDCAPRLVVSTSGATLATLARAGFLPTLAAFLLSSCVWLCEWYSSRIALVARLILDHVLTVEPSYSPLLCTEFEAKRSHSPLLYREFEEKRAPPCMEVEDDMPIPLTCTQHEATPSPSVSPPQSIDLVADADRSPPSLRPPPPPPRASQRGSPRATSAVSSVSSQFTCAVSSAPQRATSAVTPVCISAFYKKVGLITEAQLATSETIDWTKNRLPDAAASLDDHDCEVIAYLASRGAFRALKQLRLTGNAIGNKGAKTLAKVGWALPQLQVLLLGDNKIGDAGALALAEAFGRGAFQELTELRLCSLHTTITKAA